MGKLLIVVGVIVVALGLLIQLGGGNWLGRLPGDIRIERGGFRMYIPLATSLLLSAIVSFVFFVLSRWR